MPDYSKAKIYRVFCEDDEYIGSTIRPLSERMSGHRTLFKSGKTNCSSKVIFEKHGIDNVKIELIEEYPCENREQLLKREGEIQRERKCVNKCIAGRTYAEWCQDNAERIREHKRQYEQDNAEHFKEYRRQYAQDHAVQIREHKRQYYQANAEHFKELMRQYAQDHADQIREYMRQYKQDNAEHLKEYRRQYYQDKKLSK